MPTDPLIYRFYELVNVYGTTFKELIHEEFGDGIMSAIDFHMDLKREPHDKGDRVSITMSGKFLPYKTYCEDARSSPPTDRITPAPGSGSGGCLDHTEPSPTPEATRLTEPERTSPTA